MNQYPINMMQGTGAELHDKLVETVDNRGTVVAPGALGLRVANAAWLAPECRLDELAVARYTGKITALQAQTALDHLFDAVPSELQSRPTLSQFLTLDVVSMSLMVNSIMQAVCSKNVDIICQQIQRACDVQDVLRDKQLKDYQAQINKTAEQAEKVRKAGIFGAVCDWIISSVQLLMGTLRVMAGDIVGGMATIMNGVAGIIKASAESALLYGADKEMCGQIILAAVITQTIFGAVAMVGGTSSINAKEVGQASKYVTYLRGINDGIDSVNQTQKSGTSMAVADLQHQIEDLMANQSFNEGVQKWIETQKSTQYQQLRDTFQDSMQARRSALHSMDSYGTVLAHVISGRT